MVYLLENGDVFYQSEMLITQLYSTLGVSKDAPEVDILGFNFHENMSRGVVAGKNPTLKIFEKDGKVCLSSISSLIGIPIASFKRINKVKHKLPLDS